MFHHIIFFKSSNWFLHNQASQKPQTSSFLPVPVSAVMDD